MAANTDNDSPIRERGGIPGRTTLEDVCAVLGVSTATVSRALNSKPGVSEELRQKVLSTVKEMNYVPRAAARDLSRAKTDTIGVVFQDLTAGWHLSVFRGIMSCASGRGFHVITSLSTRAGDEFELPRRMIAEGRIDGLLWMDIRATPKMIREIKKQSIPFVLLQREIDDPQIDTVAIERTQGAYDAMKHLLQLGHRKLLLITGPEQDQDSHKKMIGVDLALREFGVDIPEKDRLVGHHVGAHAVKALSAYISSGNAIPEAIFCFNDDMAIAVLNWLRARGHRVPEDVAIVGFDGIDEAKYFGLTTVETPMHELGVLGTQTLIERLSNPVDHQGPRQILLKGSLRIRETCGARQSSVQV